MTNDDYRNAIVGEGIKSPKSILVLEDDMKKIGLELGGYPFATFEDGKKTLNINTENRVSNAFEVLAVAGHIAALTGKVPMIRETKFGKRVVEWIGLDEAKKSMDEALANDYFVKKMPSRVPEEIRNKRLEGTLKGDIRSYIENVKHRTVSEEGVVKGAIQRQAILEIANRDDTVLKAASSRGVTKKAAKRGVVDLMAANSGVMNIQSAPIEKSRPKKRDTSANVERVTKKAR